MAESTLLKPDQLEKLSIPELDAHLDEHRETTGKAYLRAVMHVRNRKIESDQLDQYGLTAEQYANAKKTALEKNEPLSAHLKRATTDAIKAARNVQTATAAPANVQAQGRRAGR